MHADSAVTDEASPANIQLHERVQFLFHQPLFFILFGHALAIIITVIFLLDTVPRYLLVIWCLYMEILTIALAIIIALYRRLSPPAQASKKWIRVFTLAGITTGAGWGVTAYLPNTMNDIEALVLLAIMILGVTAAALAVYASYLRSYYYFAVLSILPLAIQLFMHTGETQLTLGVMFLLYLVVILISGHNMRRAVVDAINLRLENAALVLELTENIDHAEQAREQAEQANLSKSKFLAAASHDLRQPLHALGLFVDVLDSRIHYPEIRGIVDNMKISIEALASLFNALLDISKLDAGVLEPNVTDFPLQPLFQRLLTDYRTMAENKGLRLRIVDCGYAVTSDQAMLERILRNLISNAIRYTSHGAVLLGCRRRGDRLRIEVYDTGMGIAAEHQKEIFQEFFQIENPERDRRKGLGLGLAIVKRLCELLGHSVEVSSIPGRGTVFGIAVPFVATESTHNHVAEPYTGDVKGARILVIDDEAMIRSGMRNILQEWGCHVIEAESGGHALQLLSAQQTEPDIILSDYRLRENETGIDAINVIREKLNSPVPGIIITGDTAPDRLREARESGFLLLHKPIASSKLRSLIGYLLENRP